MPFRYESLEIWHAARAYATRVYSVSAKFPRHEDYGLRSQMNRAVNSISLNIAEASAKSTKKHFETYLETSVGSAFEVVSASFLALGRGYITEQEQQSLYSEGQQLAKRTNALRNSLH